MASTQFSAFTPSNQRVSLNQARTSDVKPLRAGSGETGGHPRGGPPERQLTLMLVSVCVAFVCLRLPYTISYSLYEYTKDAKNKRSDAEDLPYLVANQITDVIATTNYMVNFFLYGLCGSYFRQQVRAAFSCCRRGGRGGWAVGGKQLQMGRGSRSGSGYSTRTGSMDMVLDSYERAGDDATAAS